MDLREWRGTNFKLSSQAPAEAQTHQPPAPLCCALTRGSERPISGLALVCHFTPSTPTLSSAPHSHLPRLYKQSSTRSTCQTTWRPRLDPRKAVICEKRPARNRRIELPSGETENLLKPAGRRTGAQDVKLCELVLVARLCWRCDWIHIYSQVHENVLKPVQGSECSSANSNRVSRKTSKS